MSAEFWRLNRVIAEVGLKRSMIYRLIAEKKFPGQFKLTGDRAIAWSADEVRQWKAAKLAERDSQRAA